MKTYPAITIPVHITAEEHAEIAAFCEGYRLTVAEFVAYAGFGANVQDYASDEDVRGQLIDVVTRRFGRVPQGEPVGATVANRVTLEFSEDALAMLEVLRRHDDHASLEDLIRHELASSVVCLFESFDQPTMADLLAPPEKEGRTA